MTNYRENETVQYEIPVDLRKSIDYVSGNLFITNQRFIFQPYNMHFKRDILEFNITDINNIDSSYVLGIVPNGITVELKDGYSAYICFREFTFCEVR